jgi:hypothetical protein
MLAPEANRSDLWDLIPQLELDDDATGDINVSSPSAAMSKVRAKSLTDNRQRWPWHRSSALSPRAENAHTRSSSRSVLSDRSPKAKHGGINSLLIRPKPSEQKPVLVDNLHHPTWCGQSPCLWLVASIRLTLS